MAEHLHGYPRCETPAGTSCESSDLHWEECSKHGALQVCEASVVDGIPTGQYRCSHEELAAPARPAVKPAGKPKKAAKTKARPKKAAPKAKKAPKKVPKKAAKRAAKKTRPAKKRTAGRRGGPKKGARKKK